VFAAAQIYNMLKEYPGNVEVRIDGMAASAASVVAMAGDKVSMSPVAMMMIHNPMTVAMGDQKAFQQAMDMLGEVKESIINAYEMKTKLNRTKISHMMDDETWFNAKKAVELGFADDILYTDGAGKEQVPEAVLYSRVPVMNSLLVKFNSTNKIPENDGRVDVEPFRKRLFLLSH
jgi:ATP-dependent Clp protease protease subunit